jgi:hypothetical protein
LLMSSMLRLERRPAALTRRSSSISRSYTISAPSGSASWAFFEPHPLGRVGQNNLRMLFRASSTAGANWRIWCGAEKRRDGPKADECTATNVVEPLPAVGNLM